MRPPEQTNIPARRPARRKGPGYTPALVTRIDQFESQFLGAAKEIYRWSPSTVDRVLVLTDLGEAETRAFAEVVQRFLAVLGRDDREQLVIGADGCRTIGDVLAAVEHHAPDLVCTYRNLHSGAWRWPHSLSDHLEVLTQVAPMPVLLMPRPDPNGEWSPPPSVGDEYTVMALTDHLAGDAALVDHAVAFTAPGGRLVLAHVEDQQTFERYMETFGKIPEIDSDVARRTVRHQLLREASDYVESCAIELARRGQGVQVVPVVRLGHRLATYRQLVVDHGVDVLVLRTRDSDQLAMHGMSYPLAVELRDVPMLMI